MEDTYGARLARAREEMGRTQPEFAAMIGIPLRTLQDIEADKVERPQRKTREKIDAALSLRREGKTAEGYDCGVKAFLDAVGTFLMNRPEDERTAFINETFVRIARWNPSDRTSQSVGGP